MTEKSTKANEISPFERFMLAGTSAAISKTLSAPIERVKLLIQNQEEMIRAGRLQKPYKGISNCFVRTYRDEGLLSFFRGNLPNILRYFPTQSLNFVFKDLNQKIFTKPKKEDGKVKEMAYYVSTGGLAGALSLSIVYSLDYARTRLANDLKNAGGPKGSAVAGQRQYSGLLDCYRKTFKSDGIRGLYRGFNISCVGIFIYRGFYFGLYDVYKSSPLKPENAFADFAAAYTITLSSGLLSYPIDTVRRRMMMTSGQEVKYKNSLDALRYIVRTNGFASLFKGAGANILRGVAGAGVLFLNDKISSVYLKYRY
ncbi:MAG: mitochondrial adenine nucleotide carrier Anc1 [Marteilia pararefringens]